MLEVLCLGARGSGKTLLLHSVKFFCTNDRRVWTGGDIPPHAPTAESGLVELELRAAASAGGGRASRKVVRLRDCPGSEPRLWTSFYGSASGILFVFDSANPASIADSITFLEDCLRDKTIMEKPFFVAFSKCDIHGPMTLIELKNVIFFDDLVEKYSRFTTVEHGSCSAVDGTGLAQILSWIEKVASVRL